MVIEMPDKNTTIWQITRMAEDFACELTHETGKVVVFKDASIVVSNDRNESPELVVKFKLKGLRN